MTISSIKYTTTSDAVAAVDVVTLAFSTDPVARWLYPNPHKYLANMPRFVRAYGGKAFVHKSAYYVEGYRGVALWLPPDVHPDEDELLSLIQHTVSKREQEDLFALFEQMESYHPKDPHWYLPLIGVDPTHQGQGYGSALMQHGLFPCDREQTQAYVESSNPRNISLYKRHGFELLGTIQVGTSPLVFPMLRKPR